MKVEYKSVVDKNGIPCSFVEKRFTTCCPEALAAFTDGPLEFGEQNGGNAPVVAISEMEPGYYGDHSTNYYPITFCPFCGVAVECVEVERVRIVETVKERQVKERRVETKEEIIWKKG